MEVGNNFYFCGEFIYRRLSSLDWGIYFLSFEFRTKLFYARTNSEEHAADWVATLNSGRLTRDKVISSIEVSLKNTEAAIERNRAREISEKNQNMDHNVGAQT